MNKQRRNELTRLKYVKRIKNIVGKSNCYVNRKHEIIYNQKWIDVVNDNGQLCYKTTGKPCSCYMCSHHKYKRNLKRIEDRKVIKESFFQF